MKATEELGWLNEVSSVPLQQALRHQQGSANRAKARAKVARAHRKVRASRADFLHRTSARLVRDHDVIVIEDLNVSGIRAWDCPSCGTRHDRDVNAAKNILAAGRAVAGDTLPGDACGADVRHSGTSRVQSAVKQEPQPVRAGIPVLQGGE